MMKGVGTKVEEGREQPIITQNFTPITLFGFHSLPICVDEELSKRVILFFFFQKVPVLYHDH